jgi:hypothetical protein
MIIVIPSSKSEIDFKTLSFGFSKENDFPPACDSRQAGNPQLVIRTVAHLMICSLFPEQGQNWGQTNNVHHRPYKPKPLFPHGNLKEIFVSSVLGGSVAIVNQ